MFDSPQHAINVLWHFMIRLGRLVAWGIIAIAHLALLTALLATAWLTETAPAEAWEFVRNMLRSSTVQSLVALGVSALTVAGLYAALIRWAHRKIGGRWLVRYLLKDAPGE